MAYQPMIRGASDPGPEPAFMGYLRRPRRTSAGVNRADAFRLLMISAEHLKAQGREAEAKAIRQRVALARCRPGGKAYERNPKGQFTS